MLKILFVVIAVSFLTIVRSQNINNPESVEYDAANDRYLVSNRANPVSIQSLVPSETPTLFATGVSSPAGLEILNGKLWVCDGGNMKSFDLTTGALVNTINVGGSFLNGITSDGSQFLFVSDFSANKIYRINTLTLTSNVMVNSTGTQPNGMWYDGSNNRLLFVSWGTSAPIKAVSLADSSVSIITTTNLGNVDGIARDGAGRYYVSSWSQSGVFRFDSDFTNQQQVLSGVTQGADIYYNTTNDTLVIPRTSGDVVTFHNFSTAASVDLSEVSDLRIFPNPTSDQLVVYMDKSFSDGDIHLELFTSEGQSVFLSKIDENSIVEGSFQLDTRSLAEGTYLIKVQGKNHIWSKTISVIR